MKPTITTKSLQSLVLSLLLAISSNLHAEVPAGTTQQVVPPGQVPEGLAKSDWASIRTAYEAGRHAFTRVEDGWQARNPGQHWDMKFDRRGFLAEPSGGGWQWGLELKRYGFPGHERDIGGEPTAKAEGQRLTYGWDAALQEWFVNDARGLEHGYTVRERPSPSTELGVPLQFDLAVRGSLVAKVGADGQGVLFCDTTGATVLNYSGLKVWDADGKVLSARFAPGAPSAGALRLLVEERGARYPITVDPIAQQAYVKASNTGAGDLFGTAVAVSGDTVVVGAYAEAGSGKGVNPPSDEAASFAGAAYVFVRTGASWSQQAYLKASNTGAGDGFGISVAISGDTIVVGAPFEYGSGAGVNPPDDNLSPESGAAYVFVRTGTTWTQQAYLKASNNAPFPGFGTFPTDRFGHRVAISGDTVVVGAYMEDGSGTGVNPPDDNLSSDSGAAYVFARSGTTWSQQAYLKASNPGVNDHFGIWVAVSDDTIVVGAPNEDGSGTGVNPADNNGATDAGAAYVFVRTGSTWSQQAYLKASNTGASDAFGGCVAISGDTIVVGAAGEASNGTGANPPDNNLAPGSGAAYVFVRSGTSWSQQAELKTSNTGAGDTFGVAFLVAVSGDTVVVGTPYEDGSGTGVNPASNESASASGAAYVFVRTGTTWSQLAYLKASNTGATDQFGTAVAVSGDTVVIGAPNEDASGTGVNPADNNLATDAGAAYIFSLGLNKPPTVTCPAVATIPPTSSAGAAATVIVSLADADNDPLTVSWTVDTVVVATHSLVAGATTDSLADQPFGFGPHTVSVSVTDGKSQAVTCETTVTVTAHDAPVPSVASLPLIQGQCSANISDIPTAADVGAAGGLVSGTTKDPLTYTAPGTYTVTWTYTDPHDPTLFTTQTQTVVVKDTTPPVIGAPGASATIECPAIPVFTPPTATDNCDPKPQIVEVSDLVTPGNCAGAFTRTKTWQAVDASGNASGIVSQTITIQDTTPPVIHCPADMTLPASTSAGATVNFLVTTADACNSAITLICTPASGSLFPAGTTEVKCLAMDACGIPSSCSFKVTVTPAVVNHPPVLDPISNQTLPEGTPLSFQLKAIDPDGDALTFSSPNLPPGASLNQATGEFAWTPASTQAGSYAVAFAVTDPSGASDSKEIAITVQDVPQGNHPPDCSQAHPSVGEIWPPDHKRKVVIKILGVTDPDGDPVSITITSILQNEPTNTQGDGSTQVDAGGVGTGEAWVRAERCGPGSGRVYEIFFTASDGKDGTCSGSVTVGVPHDQDSHRGNGDGHHGNDDGHHGNDDGHHGNDDGHHGNDDGHRGNDDGHRYDSTVPGCPRVR